MAVVIDKHSCKCKMQYGIFIKINMEADTKLTEDENGKFEFVFDVHWTGTRTGHATASLPVKGNERGTKNAGSDVFVDYEFADWTLTKKTVSVLLSVTVRYEGRVKMVGKPPCFKKKKFTGDRAQVMLKADNEEFEALLAEIKSVAPNSLPVS